MKDDRRDIWDDIFSCNYRYKMSEIFPFTFIFHGVRCFSSALDLIQNNYCSMLGNVYMPVFSSTGRINDAAERVKHFCMQNIEKVGRGGGNCYWSLQQLKESKNGWLSHQGLKEGPHNISRGVVTDPLTQKASSGDVQAELATETST